ncbi:unnamed protein product, partial [Owenia fusiformis]
TRKPKMMSSNLPFEVKNFCNYTRRLRQILRETKRSFEDINCHGNFEGVQVLSADLSYEEEEQIVSIIDKKPSFLIFGQSCYAKAVIVNEIFNQTIFPISDTVNNLETKWRKVQFKYGDKATKSLVAGSYVFVDNLASFNKPWRTIPTEDLIVIEDSQQDSATLSATLEVQICHPLLKEGATVYMGPTNMSDNLADLCAKIRDDSIPIIIYALDQEQLSPQDLEDLSDLKEEDAVVFFIKVPPPGNHDTTQNCDSQTALTTSDIQPSTSQTGLYGNESPNSFSTLNLFQQLCDLGYISMLPKEEEKRRPISYDYRTGLKLDSELVEKFESCHLLVDFTRQCLKSNLAQVAARLNYIHERCLKMFIYTAFDMARDMLITPQRLKFARDKESELYQSLMDIALKKQDEMKTLIADTITAMKETLIEKACLYDFIGVKMTESCEVKTSRDLKICTGQIQELILNSLNCAIAAKLVESIDILRDSYTGTLTRCLESLERDNSENSEPSATTEALKQILNTAYQVEITFRTSSSVVRVLLEKMKQIIKTMPWKTTTRIDTHWKQKVADDMLNSLSSARLAKSICSQIKERLKNSHDAFSSSLKQLEAKHSGRLEKTEESRLKVRKVHAPKVARLALESTSLRDIILYGMPDMGREVGRGQYGVVYSCERWAGYSPCAVKSVVPPDDKHWNDLALEFYYTKHVPDHERIVALKGSVIDYSYGGGTSPAVLLIMERMQRDLYGAIKTGLDWCGRLQVAIDVIEGMRFLHSQGLVHRDIKLKNVLLDRRNRGKLTDLGFCKPEAMMSGSIVGTPIHMAPELFSGKYDNSVDVYAFGILFWYVCAGHCRLPYAFEQCTSKDQLWTHVKKGVRPERLPQFDEECWELMNSCWAGDAGKRPLLGNVQPQLYTILERYRGAPPSQFEKIRNKSRSPSKQRLKPTEF